MTRSTTRIQKLTRVSTLGNDDVIPLGPSDGDRAKGITFANLVDSIPDNMTTVQGNSLVAHESLVCSNTTVSTVDIDANAVSVRNDVNVVRRVENINLTIDITVSGENGLDIGAEAPDTFYYYYVIFNPATLTTAGIFSLSSVAPFLPTGFTFFGLVGAIRNESDSDFRDIAQVGNLVTVQIFVALMNGSATTSSPPTSVDLSAIIPKEAIKIIAALHIDDDAANTESEGLLFSTTNSSFASARLRNIGNGTAAAEMRITTTVQIHVPQITFYRVISASNNLTVNILGWEF